MDNFNKLVEGVETLFLEAYVQDRCRDRAAQGYFFSRSVPPEAYGKHLHPKEKNLEVAR